MAYDGNGPKDVVVRYSVGTACITSNVPSLRVTEAWLSSVVSACKAGEAVEHGAVIVEVVLVRRVIVTLAQAVVRLYSFVVPFLRLHLQWVPNNASRHVVFTVLGCTDDSRHTSITPDGTIATILAALLLLWIRDCRFDNRRNDDCCRDSKSHVDCSVERMIASAAIP